MTTGRLDNNPLTIIDQQLLGLEVTHTLWLNQTGHVLNATVPVSLGPWACQNQNSQEQHVDPEGPRLLHGSFGNPTVHVRADSHRRRGDAPT